MWFRYSTLLVVSFVLFWLSACGGKSSKSEAEMETVNVKIVPFGRFSSTFNDLNDKHLSAAKANGVERVVSREDARKRGRKLKEIKTCKYYTVDPLTHSIPYLVPKAVRLLETVGEEFIDLLEERGATGYRVIVTSVLRAESDVKNLKKKNGNASDNSAHRFGTTFDIAYTRFDHVSGDYKVPDAQLKHILAEVLRKLKKEEKCYVKYEVRQGCFHVTVR